MVLVAQDLVSVVVQAVLRLAAAAPSPSPSPNATPRNLDDAVVRPGFLGFAVFLALVAAAVFLFRSMQRQLRKVDFEENPADAPPEPDAPTDRPLS